jgi:FMN phosphatase YigB (HAD superfamily)
MASTPAAAGTAVGVVASSRQVDTLIFDIDDTLYPVDCGFTAHRNGAVVHSFMMETLGFETLEAAKAVRDKYFGMYHSTVKGLTKAAEEGELPGGAGATFQKELLGDYFAKHCDFARCVSMPGWL